MHLKSAGLWLLASGVLNAAASPTPPSPTSSLHCFGAPVDDRNQYLACAKKYGLCRKPGSDATSPNGGGRRLVIPGKNVLTKFQDDSTEPPLDLCVAKNEFGELLKDTSGDIFCQGQAIHLMADVRYNPNSKEHVDSKSFVDSSRKTSGRLLKQKLDDKLSAIGRDPLIVAQFEEWNNEATSDAEELILYNNTRFPHTPDFISRIRPQARVLRAWTKIVHHKWNTLDRTLMQTYGYGKHEYLLPGPGSTTLKDDKTEPDSEKYITSAIRLEHPFVIAGGRFREQYYWDSFFIMEGLLAANMTYLARTTLLNFMDQIKAYGFIPNGARKYYLNRSQPPLFIHMLHAYVHNTDDYRILHEALPLAERELRWWSRRIVNVKDDKGKTHKVYQYHVHATGPRPESYAEDWRSAWCFEDGEEAPSPEKANDLYSEFASGAESGWDYTARWMKNPFNLPHDDDKNLKNLKQMKLLEIRNMVPVDLNSIIYRCHTLMSELYKLAKSNESPLAEQYARNHRRQARELHEAIIALHWDQAQAAFFDFVLHDDFKGEVRTGERKYFWSVASLAPYWSGVRPDEFNRCKPEAPGHHKPKPVSKGEAAENKKQVMKAFTGIRELLDTYQGPIPATLVESGQQWDFPNAWPPLQYIAIKALESIPEECIEETTIEEFVNTERPRGHFGDLEKLPEQPGPAPKVDYNVSPSWRDSLVKAVAMRYMTSTNNEGKFPEDRAEIVERDNPARDGALTYHPGHMFEKLNAISPVKAGGGGEYEVQTGFGWTNGIAIWIAHQYGAILDDPKCPSPTKDKPKAAETQLGGDLMFQA